MGLVFHTKGQRGEGTRRGMPRIFTGLQMKTDVVGEDTNHGFSFHTKEQRGEGTRRGMPRIFTGLQMKGDVVRGDTNHGFSEDTNHGCGLLAQTLLP